MNRVAAGSYQERRESSLNEAVGIPELSSKPRDYGLSFITVSGFSPIGDEYNNPQHSVTNVFQVTDTMTYSKSKHLFRFGFDFRRLQQNAYRDVQSRGFLAFSDYGQVTGNGLADMLLGFITYSGGAQLDNPQYLRAMSWNFFLQDSYRVRRNLTLQLGVRYEYNTPPVDRYDRAITYDPVSQSLVPVGEDGVPRGAYNPTGTIGRHVSELRGRWMRPTKPYCMPATESISTSLRSRPARVFISTNPITISKCISRFRDIP